MDCADASPEAGQTPTPIRTDDGFAGLASLSLDGLAGERIVIAGFSEDARIIYWFECDGLTDHALVHPDALLTIISDPAVRSVAIAHNHPSGHCRPSNNDLETTRKIARFCACAGVRLIEHLVIGAGTSYRILCPDA